MKISILNLANYQGKSMKIFYNAIFIKKILSAQKNNLSSYSRVTCFLNEETINMYRHT
ncbi:hypothetical protein XBKQ1_920001 [Xenorhabdus bovienii str. kraussei Quebec]|uniref:Uncharacterized protein n=1 Tax=Xenorhabdus bovienii str. kraussei Quebec TaxID=1398203 RepID=A0A077PNM2_XENBV|nr:hypothetical protein XBKQ1_920001 [Xenorhabdus bovienii str. kraussei Quebec]